MGQGTNGVKDDDPVKIERKVEEVRDNLTGIAGELDRRRHELFDLKLQLRRHGPAIGLTAAAMLALVGGSIALGAWSHARRQRVMSKAHRLRLALARAIADPDDVARPSPNVGKKVLAAFASAAAGVLARTAAQRLTARPNPMAN
jgi:hypothetical protein